ncbi:MAG: bacteriocin [Bacteroidetes bacterium]|nr:bacteriocin [Bacteroidota bacterium]
MKRVGVIFNAENNGKEKKLSIKQLKNVKGGKKAAPKK